MPTGFWPIFRGQNLTFALETGTNQTQKGGLPYQAQSEHALLIRRFPYVP